MPSLQTVRGRIVELRHHFNYHFKDYRPIRQSDRYELWIRPKGGDERKFTIHTPTMPARYGHEVSLIYTGGRTQKVRIPVLAFPQPNTAFTHFGR